MQARIRSFLARQTLFRTVEYRPNLPPPEVIAAEIIEDLQAALDQLKELEAELQQAPGS